MSYPKDLDDYCDAELMRELGRRKKLRDVGKCAYCSRDLATHACKYKGYEHAYIDDGLMELRR